MANKLGLFALTPGKWMAVGHYVYSRIEHEDDNPDDIELAKARTKQDAQLMAAAPDLLAICRAVNDWVLAYMDFGDRPCPFCSHHHIHSEDCLYIIIQAVIAMVKAK